MGGHFLATALLITVHTIQRRASAETVHDASEYSVQGVSDGCMLQANTWTTGLAWQPKEVCKHNLTIANQTCENWIYFKGHKTHSNLGGLGLGPKEDKELRFSGVSFTEKGEDLDLVFTNETEYVPQRVASNTIHGDFATVNLRVGHYVKLTGALTLANTRCLVGDYLLRPKLTFCDIDHVKDGENEILVIDGVVAAYTVDEINEFKLSLFKEGTLSPPLKSNELEYISTTVNTSIPGRTATKWIAAAGKDTKFAVKAESTHRGHKCDNPTDANAFINVSCHGTSGTVDQAKRCVMVEFEDTKSFSLWLQVRTYEKAARTWGRNFLMFGTSKYLAPSTSIPCRPPMATASGDPHLVNVLGQRFDILRPGSYVLIRMPYGVSRSRALLWVDADARHVGGACADTYFQSVNVSGKWARANPKASTFGNVKGFAFKAGANNDPMDRQWISLGTISLKVVHGHTQSGYPYLNILARNLKSAGHAIGGLLGEDDFAAAATPGDGCRDVTEYDV